ncbi:MAG: ANTAR domain-containing response regulator [Lachnospiraceae bacterium]
MGSIIVALPRLQDGQHIREILTRHGLDTAKVCTTASQVLAEVHQLDSGIVICGCRLPDMYYSQLAEYLPDYFELLLLASPANLVGKPRGMMGLAMPLKAGELVGTAEMMLAQLARRIKKEKAGPRKRTQEELNRINQAKWLLMERNHLTEEEAFRYLQKTSMDSGTNMVETAEMILMMMVE